MFTRVISGWSVTKFFLKSPEEDEEDEEEKLAAQQECLELFSCKDYIMEPGVFSTLKRYYNNNIFLRLIDNFEHHLAHFCWLSPSY